MSKWLAFVLLIVTSPAALANGTSESPWDSWHSSLQRQCPNQHVEWVEDGGYDELLAGFEKTLPAAARSRADSIFYRVTDKVCPTGHEYAGFSCEMGASLVAYQKLHLIDRFAAYGCANYTCTEAALCSRPKIQKPSN
jgi:hypothetical protein